MGEMMVNPKNPIPSEIFRYVDEARWADRLVAGYVWISTLDDCRRAEREGRKDEREGIHTRHADLLAGHGTDAEFVSAAEEVGVGVGPQASDIIIRDTVGETRIPDAYVICMTELLARDGIPGIGRYCVRISDPLKFAAAVTAVFRKQAALSYMPMDRVIYGPRDTEVGQHGSPGSLGFVKPKDEYAAQHEIRILWAALPQEFLLKAREVCVPATACEGGSGRLVRESSGSSKRTAATKPLRRRLAKMGGQLVRPDAERTTLEDLATLVLKDYALNGRRSN